MNAVLKKTIAIALVAVMAIGVAGCGSKPGSNSDSSGNESNTSNDGGSASNNTEQTSLSTGENAEKDYSEKYVYSIASVQVNESTDYNGDDFTKWWEEKYNFEWNVISLSFDNWAEKVRTWINSDDLPDITVFDYRHGEMLNYIDQGLVLRFPDGWEERWPNVARANELSGLGKQVADEIGGTYFLARPNYADNKATVKDYNNNAIFIRKDWAEAVGFELKDAYTMEELMEYARLIKEKDPGNVGARLVPIGTNSQNCRNIFVCAFSTYTGNDVYFYRDADGFHWGPADEEVLTGLQYWRQAYDEGLLNPEFYSYSGSEDIEDFYIAGISGMMFMQDNARYLQTIDNNMQENLGLSFDEAVWPCIVTDNDGVFHDTPRTNYYGTIIFNPNIDMDKWERYMDMLDYSCTEEGQLFIRMGFEGKDWERGADGELISLLEEGQEARSIYPSIYPIYHQLLVLSDDFGMINPNYQEKFRESCKHTYEVKEALSTDESVVPAIDWDVYFYSSDAKNALSFDFTEDFANMITSEGSVEDNWKKWIADNAYQIDPVLQELTENVGLN